MSKIDPRLTEYEKKMSASMDALSRDFASIRAGRPSPNLLDNVKVDAYGSLMPMNQVGTVTIPDVRMMVVQVWDKGLVKNVEKAIRESGLGLDPSADGQNVRVPIPTLNEQRRQELSKQAGKYAEEAKIAVRSVRRDAMEAMKKAEKAKEISEDELHRLEDEIQKMTDLHIKKVDDLLVIKQKDIMQV